MSFKNTLLPVANLLQSKGKLLDLSQAKVMGIINVTPDSFFEGSRQVHIESIVAVAQQMVNDGAEILDIGGASTRPGATFVSIQEELDRVLPAIEAIQQVLPEIWISVDTFHASVAKAAIEAGAHIVNDISAGSFDPAMINTVAQLSVPYLMMHLRGSQMNMHQTTNYEQLINDVIDELQISIAKCREAGIKDIILDPGFGFSKTLLQNFELLSNLAQLRALGLPIMAGISRKSMIYKSLNIDANSALNGTTALHMVALQQGSSILRVHDVIAAKEAIQLFELLS